jgi:hypothetical protein
LFGVPLAGQLTAEESRCYKLRVIALK